MNLFVTLFLASFLTSANALEPFKSVKVTPASPTLSANRVGQITKPFLPSFPFETCVEEAMNDESGYEVDEYEAEQFCRQQEAQHIAQLKATASGR